MIYRGCVGKLVGLLVIFLTMGVLDAEAQGLLDTPAKAKQISALRDAVERQGMLPVIVRLSEESVSTVQAGQQSSGVRKTGIAVVQERVLDALPIRYKGAVKARKYKYIPFMAMQVDVPVLETLLNHDDVEDVTQDAIYESMIIESAAVIGADAAWANGGSGAGQVIAVLDTGVDLEHPFLKEKVVEGGCFGTNYESINGDFQSYSTCEGGLEQTYGVGAGQHCGMEVDGCSHGTRVAGIAAGNGGDFWGVARDADLLPVQVFSRFESYCGETSCARSWVSDQIAGLEYIYTLSDSLDIAAVNMSLGGGHYTTEEQCDQVNPAMYAIFDILYNKGIPVIAAGGNSGVADGLVAPACLSNAISVGSTSLQDRVSTFSNSARFLDFWAPGEDILTSTPGGDYQPGSGTSFATPHVAGAWAILKSKSPSAGINQLKDAFSKTGVSIIDTRNEQSIPRIQVDTALQFALLPIELIRFDAIVEESSVELLWDTASETNNAGFEVQHSWGGRYYTVDFVPGNGTRHERSSYAYSIENLSPGTHTFRLRQIDFDGTPSLTHSVDAYIVLDNQAHMGATYPNPFNPVTQFTLTIARRQSVVIEVYNVLGARVATLHDGELAPEHIHIFSLDAGDLPSGIYLIQVLGEHFKATRSAMLLK